MFLAPGRLRKGKLLRRVSLARLSGSESPGFFPCRRCDEPAPVCGSRGGHEVSHDVWGWKNVEKRVRRAGLSTVWYCNLAKEGAAGGLDSSVLPDRFA